MPANDNAPDDLDQPEAVQVWERLTNWLADTWEAEKLATLTARLTLMVFLGGYYLRSNDWMHIQWLVATLPVVFVLIPWNRAWTSFWGDAFPLLGAAFLAW